MSVQPVDWLAFVLVLEGKSCKPSLGLLIQVVPLLVGFAHTSHTRATCTHKVGWVGGVRHSSPSGKK